jgi:two-component system chemotaxis sensor kinase CheA
LDDAALLDLICSPGFSTREESDRASGRGFGMAVVRRTVQELGGSLRLWTERGHGTRFTIELPLTLAITDALLARIGSHQFAVPQASVREVIELEESAIRRLEDGEVVAYRGMALPVRRLARELGLESAGGARVHAFVLGQGAAAVGLVVDRIVGQREIVVRSTVDPLIRVDGVSGATDLGDGRVVLILDAAAFARDGRRGGTPDHAATA